MVFRAGISGSFKIFGTGGTISADFYNRSLFSNDATTAANWQTRQLLDENDNISVDWNNRTLNSSSLDITVDYINGILSGNWNSNNLRLSGNLVATENFTKGISGQLNLSGSNLKNQITSLSGNLVLTGSNLQDKINTITNNTGNFISNSQSGQFYPASNPYKFITGLGTSNYISKFISSSGIDNSLLYDNDTNIGIGTITPEYNLDAKGTIFTHTGQLISSLGGIGHYQNLLTRSNQFSNSAWDKAVGVTVTSNAIIGPDGKTLADQISYTGGDSAGNWKLTQDVDVPSQNGSTYIGSIWLRTDTGINLRLSQNIGSTKTITVSKSWKRFSSVATGDGSLSTKFQFYSASADNTPFTIYAYGAQSEKSVEGPGCYINTEASNYDYTGYGLILTSPGPHLIKSGNLGIQLGEINPVSALDINGQINIRGGNPKLSGILVCGTGGLASWASPNFYPSGQNPSGYSSVLVTGSNAILSPNFTGVGGTLVYLSGNNLICVSGAGGGGSSTTINLINNAITGSGTLNYIPKFTTNNSGIVNSNIIDSGNIIQLGATGVLANDLYVVTSQTTTQKNYINFQIQSVKLPNMSGAHFARIDAGNVNWELLFAATGTQPQSGLWQFICPQDINTGYTPNLYLNFSLKNPQTGTNNISFRSQIASIPAFANTNINTLIWAVPNTGTLILANNLSGNYVQQMIIPLTNNSGMNTGSTILLQLDRNISSITTGASGDAALLGLMLEYTKK